MEGHSIQHIAGSAWGEMEHNGDFRDGSDNGNMGLWQTKLITLVILLLSTLLCGLIPIQAIKIMRQRLDTGGESLSCNLERALSLLNCLAGGVFFGTTMLHLIPESREGVDGFLKDAGISTNFALSEFIISAGFFIVMFVEHVVMVFRPKVTTGSQRKTSRIPPGDLSEASKALPVYGAQNLNYGATSEREMSGRASGSSGASRDGDTGHRLEEGNNQGHHHAEAHQLGTLRSFTLLLALSLHTIFEGIAIGLEKTNSGVWDLFIAIVVHKSVIAFSMGIQFAENLKTYGRAVIYIILFAIMSPIGVGVGIAVYAGNADGGSVDGAASAILQGVAAGTFLYVTFFEVLQHELAKDHCLLKVLLTIIGFGAMVLLNLFNGEPKDD